MSSQRRRAQRGQVTPMLVALLLPIFGFLVFAVDFGFIFHARAVGENAATASALAGAEELAGCGSGDADEIYAQASDFAGLNFDNAGTFDSSEVLPRNIQWRPQGFEWDDAQYDTVYTKLVRNQKYLFAQILGFVDTKVPAQAEAACLPASQAGTCPIYVSLPTDGDILQQIQLYKIYRIKDEPQTGNFGFLDLFQGVAQAFRQGCAGGASVTEGQPVDVKPGNLGNSFYDALYKDSQHEGLYSYEVQGGGSFAACDIAFDPAAFGDEDWVDPDPGQNIAQKIAQCQLDPNPDDNVLGRVWPIVVTTDEPPHGNSGDITATRIVWFYLACWPTSGSGVCDGHPSDPFYGMFISGDDVKSMVPGLGGVGDNPLAPRRPVLIAPRQDWQPPG
jgi:Putative Flp pilus-assembly TadE/G-like